MSKKPKEVHKSERLIDRCETAERLGLSYRVFARIKAHLIAQGLQEVVIGHSKKYREVSVDRIIAKAAEKGTPLGKAKK